MTEKEGSFWVDEETEELVLQEKDNQERFYIDEKLQIEGNEYLILIPSEEGTEEEEALALKLIKEDDSETLSIIEDDDEFEKVKEAYFQE